MAFDSVYEDMSVPGSVWSAGAGLHMSLITALSGPFVGCHNWAKSGYNMKGQSSTGKQVKGISIQPIPRELKRYFQRTPSLEVVKEVV